MKLTTIILGSLSASGALAYPGAAWKATLKEIESRAARAPDGPYDSNELLGDLATSGANTTVGKAIQDILTGNGDGGSSEMLTYAVAPMGSDACKADTCCIWKYVADEMAQKFRGESGRCNNFARAAVRLGFHDAGAWKKGLDYGGADGGILLTDEISRADNKGLEEIADATKQWYQKYKSYGVGMADLIQMGATVATVVCPLGPRIRSFVGRKDNPRQAQTGLLPDANQDANTIIQMFMDKTIKPHGLVALLGAHTTSQQRFFNPQRALDPQDSSPGVWDVRFYKETLDPNAPKRVLKFPSDISISKDSRAVDEWKQFTDPVDGQKHWNDDFAKEYVRLSLLGVNNINSLKECTKVLPQAVTSFGPPDVDNIFKWANGGYASSGSKFGQLLLDGKLTTNQTLPSYGIDPKTALDGFGLIGAAIDAASNLLGSIANGIGGLINGRKVQ